MPVRRSLLLDTTEKVNNEMSPRKTSHQFNSYSPTTGTCQMSSVASERKGKNIHQVKRKACAADTEPSPDNPSRGQRPTEGSADILELLSEVENSLEDFLKMRKSLKNLQALEGSRELGYIFGFEDKSCDLRAELQKTKVLMSEVRKRKHLNMTKI
ncbi:centromere protein R [Rhinophrynus dorsalis]